MAVGFRGVRQYLGWSIFMYKVTSKIRFDVLLGGGGAFMKNAAVALSVPKLIYGWSLTDNLFQTDYSVEEMQMICIAKNDSKTEVAFWID